MASERGDLTAIVSNHSICPVEVQNCSMYGDDRVSYDMGVGPSYVAIVSSVLSCLGSILIVFAFIAFKDIRSGMAQRIVTALAVADFVSAAGYIVGLINFLVYFDHASCPYFTGICRGQAFVTSWSSMSSFAWTAILAIYFYIVLAFKRRRPFHSKLQEALLHLFAWVSPLLIVIPFTAVGYLGYAPYAASNWCFVSDPFVNATENKNPRRLLYSSLKILAAGKVWEILTYLIVIILYSQIIYILEKIRRANAEPNARSERGRVERKMIYIPVLFLLLRMWGTIDFFLNISMEAIHPSDNGCILKEFHTANLVLGYLQAVGDPGQGWGNAILYVFLSDTIRTRLLSNPLRRCFRRIGYRLLDLTHNSADPDPPEVLKKEDEHTPLLEDGAEPSTPDRMTPRRRAIQKYDTMSTISATDLSQPGPYEVARPGPSPTPEQDGRQRFPVMDTLLSETTTTTTTALDMAKLGSLPNDERQRLDTLVGEHTVAGATASINFHSQD